MIKIKIGILVGSLRKESYNRMIAKYIIKNYSDLADLEIIEIDQFPLFNEDLEASPPEVIDESRKHIKTLDGIIVITPEYNYSIPGPLKNALDWFSRDNYPLMGKPYFIMGGSTGTMGTVRAQLVVREILNSGAFKMKSVSNNEFLIANIQENIDEDGNLTSTRTIKKLDGKMKELINLMG